jgi:hypothetical protein
MSTDWIGIFMMREYINVGAFQTTAAPPYPILPKWTHLEFTLTYLRLCIFIVQNEIINTNNNSKCMIDFIYIILFDNI